MDRITLATCLAVAACVGSTARAADSAAIELAALESLLEQETEIVTRTKMNRDFVPGMVTVLQGETLQTLGARTVWDALPYVPGVRAGLAFRGLATTAVRGIDFPFNSGNIRILIDGVPIARESAGQNIGSALFIPLSQVERLEFIRGPGAVVYGDFAFMGLLNIVTRKQDNQVQAQVTSRNGYGGAVMFNTSGSDWQASLNAAASTTSEALLPRGDGLKGDEDLHSVFANFSRGGFSAQLSALGRGLDITQGSTAGSSTDETNWSLSSRYQWSHSGALTGNARVRYLHNDFEQSGPDSTFKGDEYAGGIEFNWTGWQGQDWLFGAEYSKGKVDEATVFLGAEVQQPQPGPPQMGPQPGPPQMAQPQPGRPVRGVVSFSGDDREVVSLYAQGQIELHPTLHFIIGARYDDVDIIGDRITPRASLVWQAADSHILKAQYAEGFRTPTFFERAGSPPNRMFDFEVNKTIELSYIYRRPELVFRGTVFDSKIEDMVFLDVANGGFGNVARAEAQGIELELSKRFGNAVTVEANVSVVDSKHNRNIRLQTVSPGTVPDWMANLGVIWNVSKKIAVAAHWNHLADRASAAPRSGSLDQVDLTVTINDFLTKGLQLRFGVTNVFDDDAIHILGGPAMDSVFTFDTNMVWAQARWNWK